ncbi:hypothetical protein DB31_0960 [Hyalangium minutum]|uniref:Uncharacterized protein n=2 Tax=Hyalangium minutum TaxID=394096 RepID=A0A085WFM4_9BACT|nr:hypothetical protein DB31_0960 [Hyalangium minutum]
MFSTDDSSWLWTLGVVVPVVLAARKKPRSGGKKPPRAPRKERFPWFAWLVVILSLGAIVVTLGIRLVVYYTNRPAPGAAAGQSPLPSMLEDTLREQMRTEISRNCPKLAALTWGDGGQPRQIVLSLASVECMSRMCEQLGGPDGGTSPRSQPHPLCESAFAGMKDQMMAVTNNYRLVCPEIAVPWAERPWSPSSELGFYAALRPCLERICERLVMGEGIPSRYCVLAADIAEGFGEEQAAVRLRERARSLEALSEVQWQGLTPQQREKAEMNQDMKLMAKRWGEVCAQGMEKYCGFRDEYCRVEGYPPDVCTSGAEARGPRDAGVRAPPRE